jgi:hypothetical protein
MTMLDVLIEVVLAPALVAVATLAARRWGNGVGGLVSAFPAIVGPVLLIAALQHGSAFAARAANGTLLGLVALATFAVAYGAAARRLGWPGSLAAGWAAAGVAGLVVGNAAAGPPAGLAAAAVSLGLAHRMLAGLTRAGAPSSGAEPAPPPRAPAAPSAHASAPALSPEPSAPQCTAPAAPQRATEPRLDVPPWDLPLRMALTAALVVSLTWAAGRFGAVAGGVLAALPVLASILAAFTHARHGPDAAAVMLRGMLAGMAGFVAFCALVWLLVEPVGIAVAFAAAATAAAATQLATARAGLRRAPAPAPAPAPAQA